MIGDPLFKMYIQRLQPHARRAFSSSIWPSWLTAVKGAKADVIISESNDILFNLATEEYIFEHVEVQNPLLFLWRNKPTIIIGKHQNPWKECHVQKLE
jgi:lipoate-protein ligase A